MSTALISVSARFFQRVGASTLTAANMIVSYHDTQAFLDFDHVLLVDVRPSAATTSLHVAPNYMQPTVTLLMTLLSLIAYRTNHSTTVQHACSDLLPMTA
jgi:hypothetical protein